MKRLVRWCIATAIIAGVILVLGDARDPWLWGYIATFSLIGAVCHVCHRRRPGEGAFHSPVQRRRPVVTCLGPSHRGAPTSSSALPTAGSDGRASPTSCAASAWSASRCLFMLIVRAMLANRFFSAVVRIQDDSGHHVVDSGPYSVVRHPGYAGMIVFAPLSGLALGSWLSVAVAFVYSALVLRRVLFEDRFLQNEPRWISRHTRNAYATDSFQGCGESLSRSGQDEAAALEAPVA